MRLQPLRDEFSSCSTDLDMPSAGRTPTLQDKEHRLKPVPQKKNAQTEPGRTFLQKLLYANSWAPSTKIFRRYWRGLWLAGTQENRNSPELLCNLAFGVWNLRLPQFDRISLRVMHAGKPAGGIGRVNLDLDSCGP